MLSKALGTLIKDSVHGGMLKALALAARAAFLIYVFPRLPSGELTAYVFINSTALLFATFVIFGLNEELPRIIQGRHDLARKYSRVFLLGSVAVAVGIALLLIWPLTWLAVAVYALAALGARYLGGLIRSIDLGLYEHLQNVPWLIFLPIVIVTEVNSGIALIVCMCVCMLLVQWICFYRVARRFEQGEAVAYVSLVSLLRHSAKHGFGKQLSNLFVLGFVRGPVLWPVWLSSGVNLDAVAFAVAAGEVVSQFGLIPVNRAYARWCRIEPLEYTQWRTAVVNGAVWWLLLAVIAAAGISLADLLGVLQQPVDTRNLLVQAMFLFAFLPTFKLIRYLLWARALLDWAIVVMSFALFLGAAVITYMLPINAWFPALLALVVSGWFILVLMSRPQFSQSNQASPE